MVVIATDLFHMMDPSGAPQNVNFDEPVATFDARYVLAGGGSNWSVAGNVLQPLVNGNGVLIDVPTADREALILQTTDDASTKNLLELRDSGGDAGITITPSFKYRSDTFAVANFHRAVDIVMQPKTFLSVVGQKFELKFNNVNNAATSPHEPKVFNSSIGLFGTAQVTNAFGVVMSSTVRNTALLTNLKHLVIRDSVLLNSGAITNQFGLVIEDLEAAGTLNQAILTGIGIVQFGDATSVLGSNPTSVQLTVKGAASQSANLQEWQDSNGLLQASLSSGGDLLFESSGSGLAFGEIFVTGNAVETAIGAAGKANRVQVAVFDTDGVSNNATPDHTNNHITITKAGIYMVNVCIHANSPGGGGAVTFGWSIYKNNGTVEVVNLHSHRGFSGGGAEAGSSNVCGMAVFDVNDTIELWCWNEDDAQNVVNEDVGISIIQIGA